jgi:AraC-like DNA-binding protein
MKDVLINVSVKDVLCAIYVAPKTGKTYHNNRPSHGLVLNDDNSYKTYCFTDGTVLKTLPNDLYYLPKGSSYKVIGADSDFGGCYAINFDADFICQPFKIKPRDKVGALRDFCLAEKSYRLNQDNSLLTIKKVIYDILIRIVNDIDAKYTPNSKLEVILPAIKKLEEDFNQNDITVSSLASLSGVSEAYFRRLFNEKFGISPREFIIQKRIDYAKKLLKSGQFSVGEISLLCGYAEQCHFSREFYKRVGVSPKDFC